MRRDYVDLAAGGALFALGVATVWYSLGHYQMGTPVRMGPGMFPTSLGVLLTIFGTWIAVPAMFRSGMAPAIAWKPLLAVFGGLIVFALLIERAGLIPAIVGMTLVSVIGDGRHNPLRALMTAAVLSLGATLIFAFALGLPLAPFRWRW